MGRPKRWTEQAAESLAKEIEAWFMASEENLFFKQFFVERQLDRDLVQDLQSVSDVFSRTIKRLEDLQELRLAQLMLRQKINPVAAIFVLKNKHNWADRQEIKSENRNINADLSKQVEEMSEEALREKIRELTGGK